MLSQDNDPPPSRPAISKSRMLVGHFIDRAHAHWPDPWQKGYKGTIARLFISVVGFGTIVAAFLAIYDGPSRLWTWYWGSTHTTEQHIATADQNDGSSSNFSRNGTVVPKMNSDQLPAEGWKNQPNTYENSKPQWRDVPSHAPPGGKKLKPRHNKPNNHKSNIDFAARNKIDGPSKGTVLVPAIPDVITTSPTSGPPEIYVQKKTSHQTIFEWLFPDKSK